MRALFIGLAFFLISGTTLGCRNAAEAPKEIAGFELDSNIEEHRERLDMETVLPVRHREYLSEVHTKNIEGYKSGYVVFGTCAEPGRVVRIKMKYANSDKEFYDRLLGRFREKFGNPDEWRGDPFHTFHAWKWSFTDENNNSISLILQHGLPEDIEHTTGNSVKLTNWTVIDNEQRCYEAKRPKKKPERHEVPPGREISDLDYFVPK